MQKIDFLAIGDLVIDAFIKLKDANVHCNINNEACELCVRFGDKVPFESVDIVNAVGNSPNASVAAARLGLSSALYANIGDDNYGKDCLKSLEKDNVIIDFIKVNPGLSTNYHYVLWYGAERTILVNHTKYPYSFPSDMPKVGWIYLSSLAENSLPLHEEILKYLKNNPETKLAFQPGTFQMKMGYEKLKDVYARSDLFFCNKEEAQRILDIEEHEIKILLQKMRELGPRIVVISDGPNGAYSFDGNETWFITMYPDIAPPIDRTGAGDAFSSTFTIALALGKTIPEALSWGPINSMNVVQYVGAQKGLLSREKLEEYLKNAPENYKPQLI
ncbi:MAG: Sugar kinase, ribokinase family [Candidatus Nomurabacteria bacterium GW2011_GWB1_37_5]|uniref:Sugar kinase, ribokinase family n=1 Tax=Candidatus Nomurabacteria bacterium GW2011_GWB1_37_5 TaxID=1618742 RepID=A0A0G0K217_9BACT|nr:MAG: Sugar kinase, ribokinase family [Candidatus Nomurabacteria bacterium GW2011_GWB1_37_5]